MVAPVAPLDAGGSAATAPLDALAAAVAAWVAGEMGLAPPASLPRIEFLDARGMAALRYGTDPGSEPPPGLTVVALYDDDAQVVYLPQGWTGATAADRSVLVHEMTHHLQNASGRTYACPEEREAEAFAIQERWLELSGTRLEAEFELDPLALFVLTRCLGR